MVQLLRTAHCPQRRSLERPVWDDRARPTGREQLGAVFADEVELARVDVAATGATAAEQTAEEAADTTGIPERAKDRLLDADAGKVADDARREVAERALQPKRLADRGGDLAFEAL